MSPRGILSASANTVKFDEGVRHGVYGRDGYKCAYCGHHDKTGSGAGLSIDHISSLETGGESQHRRTDGDRRTNLITACGPCNSSKQDKSPRAFNAFLKAGGGQPADFAKIRAQAAKKIDLAAGDRDAKIARAYRGAGSYLDFRSMKIPDATDKPGGTKAGPGIHHGPDGKFLPSGGMSRTWMIADRFSDSFGGDDQPRDDHGRWGSGGGPPKQATHVNQAGGSGFGEKGNSAHQDQTKWAAVKAAETGKPVFMQKNPGYDPKNLNTGGPYKLAYKPPKNGEYHEVKPDGSIAYHAPAPKPIKSKGVHARLTLARGCESLAAGEAPHAFRILRAGTNDTDKGPLVFTPKSAGLVMQAFAGRGNPLALYYDHEDQVPQEKRGGTAMRGVCAAPSATLAVRGPAAAPELWAENVAWTDEAKRQIHTGERRQISPVAAYDKETREVLEVYNVSLCTEGATHNGTLLASRGGERSSSVDDLIDQIMAALEAGDFESAETLVQQAEEMAGSDASMAKMAKMARAYMKSAKDGAAVPPMPPKVPAPAAATKLAASRVALMTAGIDVDAIASERAGMIAATREAHAAAKRSDRATVQTLIAANRPLFDSMDEREHMNAADPDATQRHIASLSRKTEAGIVTLSKATDGAADARPGERGPKGKSAVKVETFGLTETEMGIAAQQKITFEAFAASKARVAGPRNGAGKVSEA